MSSDILEKTPTAIRTAKSRGLNQLRQIITSIVDMDIDDYFSPGSQFRDFAKQRGDVHTVYYNVPNKAFEENIASDDPVWEKFEYERSPEQSFDVVILADLPGAYGGAPVDIRRKIIPLQKKSWSISFMNKVLGKGLEELVISITSSGIILDPPPVEG